ncbi:hypothetical protein [Cryptosporangium phraense]|uniref:hypothetical protein n=1 Tax=Cryptosporangium phraense TaxID=2593070 RepID=UPI003B84A8ED
MAVRDDHANAVRGARGAPSAVTVAPRVAHAAPESSETVRSLRLPGRGSLAATTNRVSASRTIRMFTEYR